MNKISIDALNMHLFETIEMLKNNSDPQASDNEKISIQNAKAITEAGRIIIEGYKVKVQAMNIVVNNKTGQALQIAEAAGIVDNDKNE
ncbi:MAG: hypothetical protein PHZ24_09065 [Bacteroidales bacterium]|nr:hypothetical protein [Bacteroidales bacterium]